MQQHKVFSQQWSPSQLRGQLSFCLLYPFCSDPWHGSWTAPSQPPYRALAVVSLLDLATKLPAAAVLHEDVNLSVILTDVPQLRHIQCPPQLAQHCHLPFHIVYVICLQVHMCVLSASPQRFGRTATY